jgi:ketosteroid isomerase-like protein
MTPQEVVKAFIERINAHDVEGMYELMSEDHAFIDSDGFAHEGRDMMRKAWQDYFTMMPDYWIECDQILSEGEVIAVFGKAGGTYTRDGELKVENMWEVPAAWRAVVRGDKVSEWRIYVDVEPIRQIMARESE